VSDDNKKPPSDDDKKLEEMARRLEQVLDQPSAADRALDQADRIPSPPQQNSTNDPPAWDEFAQTLGITSDDLRKAKQPPPLPPFADHPPSRNDLRRDIASAIEESGRPSEVPSTGPHMSDPVPKNWVDAVPAVLFGFYGLGFALEAVAAMNRGEINVFILDSIACVVLTAIAVMWVKYRKWLPAKLVSTTTLVVTDARWLVGAAAVLLIASALSPYAQQRHFPFIGESTSPTDVANVTAPLQSRLEEVTRERDAARAEAAQMKQQLAATAQRPAQPPPQSTQGPINWQADFQLVATGGGPEAQINSVLFQGTSTTSVEFKEAYAISGITGHRQDLVANVQYRGYYPVTKIDIPPDAPVWLELMWKPPLSIRDFIDQWGKFRITFVYNNIKYEKEYSEEYIRRWVHANIPGSFGPRVTPREDK
jgi:hypothetical protein